MQIRITGSIVQSDAHGWEEGDLFVSAGECGIVIESETPVKAFALDVQELKVAIKALEELQRVTHKERLVPQTFEED